MPWTSFLQQGTPAIAAPVDRASLLKSLRCIFLVESDGTRKLDQYEAEPFFNRLEQVKEPGQDHFGFVEFFDMGNIAADLWAKAKAGGYVGHPFLQGFGLGQVIKAGINLGDSEVVGVIG
jgi:hypothetical protein